MNDGVLFNSVRLQPSNLQAEQSLLGAILANNKAFERVVDFLEPQHFNDPINGRIFQRIAEKILDGGTADAVALKADFENSGILDEVGGTAYLAQLLSAMVGITHAAEYGRAVHDTWIRRQLIDIAGDISANAYGAAASINAMRQVEEAEAALGALTVGNNRRTRTLTAGEAVRGALAMAENVQNGSGHAGLMSGMPALDRATDGFWDGTLTLLAGIPGAGKTALAVQAAYMIALTLRDAVIRARRDPGGLPGVAIFSLEMSAEELGLRLAAWRAGVHMRKVRRGEYDFIDAGNLIAAQKEAESLPLRIIDCTSMSLSLLSARVRTQLRRQPERMVVVDHLLALENDNPKDKGGGGLNAAVVSKTTRDLKQSARDLNIPLLVLTHANRGDEKFASSRPTMKSLKWAGEGDADMVVFVHRPEMHMDTTTPKRGDKEGEERYANRLAQHHQELERVKGLAELVVPKSRQGPPIVERMRFNGATTSFSEWDA